MTAWASFWTRFGIFTARIFYSNPLGVQTDAIYTEGQGYDFSFDTLWDNAGRVTGDGYIVFFSIPFKSLRFSSDPEQTWGVALYRVILRKSEYDYWPYLTQRVQGLTQQFAPLGGLENVSPGRNIQLIGGADAVNGPFAPTKQFTTDVLLTSRIRGGRLSWL